MVWCALTRAYKRIPTALDVGQIDDSPSRNSVDWRASVLCSCDDTGKVMCAKHFNVHQLRLLEHRSEWLQSAAKNTPQSVDYCLKDEMLGLGLNTVAPALMIAVSHLGICLGIGEESSCERKLR